MHPMRATTASSLPSDRFSTGKLITSFPISNPTLPSTPVPADTTADVLLAVQEAAQNGVCTGAGHAVHVAVWPQGRVVSASVKDYGEGLADDPSRVCPPAWNTHGRGLHLMRRVMDRVAIDCSDGTSVCMRRHSLSRSQSA